MENGFNWGLMRFFRSYTDFFPNHSCFHAYMPSVGMNGMFWNMAHICNSSMVSRGQLSIVIRTPQYNIMCLISEGEGAGKGTWECGYL